VASRPRSPSGYFAAASRSSRSTTSHLISVRLPDELIQRLAAVGNEEALSMSDTIRLVLERGLASRSTSTPTTKRRRT
jgi:hypothetical protein